MKVIVAIDQKNLGQRGDIIKVKDGYARNFLIPRGIVLPYSEGNLKKLDMEKASYEKKVKKEMVEVEKLAEAINGTTLKFVEKVHDEGKLYGSISEKDIYERLKKEGFAIEKDQVLVEEHLKFVGEHDIAIKLKGGNEATVKVIIEAEAQEEQKPEVAAPKAPVEETPEVAEAAEESIEPETTEE